jgi:biotin operon repressor
MKVAEKNKLVQTLVEKSQKLNEEKLAEVLDFTEFLVNKCEEGIIKKGIQVLARQSKSLKFLTKEPDLYSLKDVKL